MKNKRGQMKLSFGMMFSIILIIIFIIVAFYAIKKFLDFKNTAEIAQFKENLQNKIDDLWRSSQGSQEFNYSLTKKINFICFIDFLSSKRGPQSELYEELKRVAYEEENLVFYPIGSAQELNTLNLKHLNIEKITLQENPFCIKNLNGNVNMILSKNYNESLVNIKRKG